MAYAQQLSYEVKVGTAQVQRQGSPAPFFFFQRTGKAYGVAATAILTLIPLLRFHDTILNLVNRLTFRTLHFDLMF
jgi:hypothetical protein